jgi:DNA polymerase III subunit gamma/tau
LSYKTLYRTYRPQTFSEVVGQEHITRTFKNALSNDKISHAYLFTGPRGTGKTSVAKIIAKAVNCEQAPTSDPCNQCVSCMSINQGNDSDVYEMDAASNNGVDEIREIRDKVKYAPTMGRYKVYIVDEVHMLSTGAFNALLKTLEEPPKHVIFILATTEPHKIPATIISRCQRFDFKSISINDMALRIKHIVSEENINIEENAILTVAKNAQGGMRDALSLLDQAISYSDEIVTEENVHEITGTLSEEHLSEMVHALHCGDTLKAITNIDQLISIGKDPLRLVENLIAYYRDLFLIKKVKTIDAELILNSSEKTIQIANEIDEEKVFSIITILNSIQYEMRKTNSPRVFIELGLFEIVNYLNKKPNEIELKQVEQPKVERPRPTIQPQPEYEEVFIPAKPIKQMENKQISPIRNDAVEKKYVDVKMVEYILNNGNKNKKINLMKQWKSIYGNNLDYANIEQILMDGQVEAVSNDNQILLSYEDESACAKLYEDDIYKIAELILKSAFNEPYSIIPLPKRMWEAKRDEFMEQYKNQVKHPTLTPIDEPIIIRKSNNQYEFESEMVKEAINIFGEAIVEIKK